MLLSFQGTSRIVRDIEVKYTKEGNAVASTAIVNSRKWKNKNTDELMEDSCFIDVTAFGKTAEFLNQHFAKGKVLLYNATLVQDKWEDRDGNKRSKHSLILDKVAFPLTEKGEGGDNRAPSNPYERGTPVSQAQAQPAQQSAPKPQEPQIPEIDIDSDEIPF